MTSLVLGTAQLGMRYGVANKTGQPDKHTAIEIVRAAWEGGIREFDTAQEYGESEQVLGEAFSALGIEHRARVITKLAKDIDLNNVEAVAKAVRQSITNLGVPKLYALLLHKEELLDKLILNNPPLPPLNLRGGEDDGILNLRGGDLVEHIGISVYSPERALQVLEMDGIDIIQIPTNILDRRFENVGVLTRANENKKQIYIRSAFLQGLILMDPNNLFKPMVFAKPIIEQVVTLAKEFGTSPLEMALGYLKISAPEARVIVGVETPEQIREIITVWKNDFPLFLVERVRELFANVNEKILNPSLW